MKKKEGITLVSLSVAVIILMIISSVTVRVGIDSYKEVKLQNFISQLKLIQAKVDNLAEETDDVTSYGFTALSSIATTNPEDYEIFTAILERPENYHIDKNVSWNEELDREIENYYYFSPENFEKMGLKNQKMTVIINFKTRNVITKDKIRFEESNYYRQYDLLQGDQLK